MNNKDNLTYISDLLDEVLADQGWDATDIVKGMLAVGAPGVSWFMLDM